MVIIYFLSKSTQNFEQQAYLPTLIQLFTDDPSIYMRELSKRYKGTGYGPCTTENNQPRLYSFVFLACLSLEMFQAQPTNKTQSQSQDTVKGLRVKPPGTINLYKLIEISSQGPLYLTSETSL